MFLPPIIPLAPTVDEARDPRVEVNAAVNDTLNKKSLIINRNGKLVAFIPEPRKIDESAFGRIPA